MLNGEIMNENNTEINNPVNRLSAILDRIYDISAVAIPIDERRSRYINLGEAVYLVVNNLEIRSTSVSLIESEKGYMILLTMCNNAWEFVFENSGDRGRKVNLNQVEAVYSIIRGQSHDRELHKLFNESAGGINGSMMTNLYALAENLRAYGKDSVITNESITEITDLIDELIIVITESNLSISTKSKLVSALHNLRSNVVRANFIGNDALTEELDIFLGRMVTTLPQENTKDSSIQAQSILDKASNLANVIDKAVSVYNKVYPLAQGVAVLVGLTLPKLPS